MHKPLQIPDTFKEIIASIVMFCSIEINYTEGLGHGFREYEKQDDILIIRSLKIAKISDIPCINSNIKSKAASLIP